MTADERVLCITETVLTSLWDAYDPLALEPYEGLLLTGKGSDGLWYCNSIRSGPKFLDFFENNSVYIRKLKEYLKRNQSKRKIVIWSQYHPDRINTNLDSFLTSLIKYPFEEIILLKPEDRSFRRKPDIEYLAKEGNSLKLAKLEVLNGKPIDQQADQNIMQLMADWIALYKSLGLKYLH